MACRRRQIVWLDNQCARQRILLKSRVTVVANKGSEAQPSIWGQSGGCHAKMASTAIAEEGNARGPFTSSNSNSGSWRITPLVCIRERSAGCGRPDPCSRHQRDAYQSLANDVVSSSLSHEVACPVVVEVVRCTRRVTQAAAAVMCPRASQTRPGSHSWRVSVCPSAAWDVRVQTQSLLAHVSRRSPLAK